MTNEDLYLEIYIMQTSCTLKVDQLGTLLDALLTKIDILEDKVRELEGNEK